VAKPLRSGKAAALAHAVASEGLGELSVMIARKRLSRSQLRAVCGKLKTAIGFIEPLAVAALPHDDVGETETV
jgi:hypothetical protein